MPHDYRTTPGWSDGLSFFVYDNLRSVQDGTQARVCYFDTIQEAMAVYRYLGAAHPEWAAALGGSIQGRSEVDLVQRRHGDSTLITDYQRMDLWKDNPEVKEALEAAVTGLGVEWQADHELLGSPVLVPQEYDEPPLDGYLRDKALRPADRDDALSSVQEIYCDGEGWMSLQELKERAKHLGYESDDYPKVTRLNIAYRVHNRSRTGYVDIAPADFRIMKAGYLEAIQNMEHPKEAPQNVKTMDGWRAFAEETSEHGMDSYFHTGDPVGQDVVDYFVNVVPPATNREHLMQIGSPYDSRMGEDGRLHPTFATFAKEDGSWRYAGHCFRGEAKEPAEQSVGDLAELARDRAAERNASRPAAGRASKAPDLDL